MALELKLSGRAHFGTLEPIFYHLKNKNHRIYQDNNGHSLTLAIGQTTKMYRHLLITHKHFQRPNSLTGPYWPLINIKEVVNFVQTYARETCASLRWLSVKAERPLPSHDHVTTITRQLNARTPPPSHTNDPNTGLTPWGSARGPGGGCPAGRRQRRAWLRRARPKKRETLPWSDNSFPQLWGLPKLDKSLSPPCEQP